VGKRALTSPDWLRVTSLIDDVPRNFDA